MAILKKLVKIYTPEGKPGFLGEGHTARPVLGGNYSATDPFIIMMDDILDKKDNEPAGGPHPHAGFETVSLMLEGEMGDEDHTMKAGDFQIMTAGSGIVHTETIDKKIRMRLLQLWFNLPKKDRWATPGIQNLPLEHVPRVLEEGVEIKVYSGSLAGITSPVKNNVPLIVADISIQAGVTKLFDVPANYNTFIYVLEGSATIGAEEKMLTADQVGWLNITADEALSELKVTAGNKGVRFVLYAGKPLGENIYAHGPFITDNAEDTKRLYREYREGKLQHISSVPKEQNIMW